jgi:NAD(P)-dependent dehydrogenase (short-subunit alcohol dehydrogenase family)
MADVALVCGAGGALGGSLVEVFLARGDRVVAVDRSAGPRTDGVRAEAADLTRPDDIDAIWDRLEADGELPRWVVNAVGGFRGGTVAETEPDAYRFVLDLNLGTALWSCRAAARRLEPGGAIVNLAARAAVSGGTGSAAYSVAKAGVVRLTQLLAEELKERDVRVNAILPSLIDTPANRATSSPEAMARAVPPEQIASVAAFLCSDAAAAISGTAVPVYGRA